MSYSSTPCVGTLIIPQYFHTIPTSCAILPTIHCVCCVHRRVMEGSRVGNAGCAVHVDIHGE